ncbi:uncharacterized protein NMK_1945 [Novimethylophilus kurashikiensis]|uniref:Filamentous haemagglutinin FhaB/tRNA nuclease CdiA-like TPS domain-containing protein n=1 Tax=Novimethylophilus kurashikiensis TaxID=1825523 RepID=A0A2R5F801_9PROT|nr:MBG domain-containing protein [Novimethylophilus kurashikiensis]GBG14346.1 uncharacterized protein NMK_1945 [Novimethylophilus kurashikiensis]
MTTTNFRPKAIAAIIASLLSSTALANPTGASVVSGVVNLQQVGSTLKVTASDKAIINWGSFSINQNEVTQFLQPSASATVLNRVVGQDPSVILGQLQANGRVFLVNPNGIVFGQGAQVNVGGLVASTLDIKNADFLAGNYAFSGDSTAKVSNAAFLETPSGGRIVLLGQAVENSGVIHAQNGEIWLAAGNSVTLADSAQPGTYVTVKAPAGSAVNMGQLIAEHGVIGLVGLDVSNSGAISASGLQSSGGHVYLVAQGANSSLQTTSTSVITANGDGAGTQGGTIKLKSDNTGTVGGSLTANGGSGFIETSAGYLDASGASIEAKDGTWLIDPYNIEIVSGVVGNASTNTGTNPITYSPTGSTSQIGAGAISSILNGGTSVVVDTTNAGGAEAGNITVSAAITKTAGGNASLSFQADNSITVNAGISSTAGTLDLNFFANKSTPGAGGTGTVAINAAIDTNGGAFNVSNANSLTIGSTVNALGGVAIGTQTGTQLLNSSILNAGTGKVSITGSVSELGTTKGLIQAGSLSVSAVGQAVDLTGNNSVGAIAIDAAGSGQSIAVTTTGALSITTVDGIAGINANGGNLNLTAGGNVSQTDGITGVNSLSVTAANADLSTASNSVAALGNVSTGNFLLANAGVGLTLNGVVSATTATITTAGDLTLGAASQLNLSGAGNALVLQSDGVFRNQSNNGSAAISLGTAGANWLIYSSDYASIVTNGLAGNGRYGCTYAACGPNSAALTGLTGNRFVFQNAPTLTVTPGTGQSRTYDGTDTAGDGVLGYTLSGYLFNDVADDSISGSLTRAAGSNVGTYNFIASNLASNLGYQIQMTGSPATYAITPKSITYTTTNNSITYGDVTSFGSYTLNGVIAADLTAVGATQGLTLNGTSINPNQTLHAGTYVETLTGLTGSAAGNYTLASTGNTTGTLTVNQRGITVTAANQTSVYGDPTQPLTYSVTTGSLVGTDSLTGALNQTGVHVGNYSITQGTLAASSDYALTYVGGTYSITQRGITVTAGAQSKTYGNGDPTLSYAITTGSLVGSDSLTGGLTRQTGEHVGTYNITQGTLSASSDYSLTFVGNTLTVNKRNIGVTADPASKTFGGNDPIFSYTVSSGSLVNGDTLSGGLTRDAGEAVGQYVIRQGTLSASGDYNLNFTNGQFSILAAPVVVPVTPVPTPSLPVLSVPETNLLSNVLTTAIQTPVYGVSAPQTPLQVDQGRAKGELSCM